MKTDTILGSLAVAGRHCPACGWYTETGLVDDQHVAHFHCHVCGMEFRRLLPLVHLNAEPSRGHEAPDNLLPGDRPWN